MIRLAACRIAIAPDRVVTTLPDGAEVHGEPHATVAYALTAAEHGYGANLARMNRTHEVTHSLVAHWLGLPCSPTFRRIADGKHDPDEITQAEESAVLALERFANMLDVDLVGVAIGCAP